MNEKVTYHQQVSYCGKPRCRKCRDGIGHGPYWYAYRVIDGRTTRTYIGKELPPGIQPVAEAFSGGMDTSRDAQDTGLVSSAASSIHSNEAVLRISVLGQFRIEQRRKQHWQSVTDSIWQRQPVRALLGYLVSSPRRVISRKQAIEALWPDEDMQVGSDNLNKCVDLLRSILEPERPLRGRQHSAASRPTAGTLNYEGDLLVLADQARVWVDADAFEELLSQSHALDGGYQQERLLQAAAELYAGDFLPEERTFRKTIARRLALRRSWIGLLLDLAHVRIARGILTNAIDVLDRLLAVDPANEAASQLLILSLARLNRRGEALRAYHRLVSVLQREYHMTPSQQTQAVYEAVRQGADLSTMLLPSMVYTAVPAHSSAKANEKTDLTHGPETTDYRHGIHTGTPSDPTHQTIVQFWRTHQSPLIGREAELDVLQSLLQEVEQSSQSKGKNTASIPLYTKRSPQSVLLMGEVGIGKTRLAEEVSREAQRKGWAVLWGRAYAQESGVPYRLWTEILRKAMSQGLWQPPAKDIPPQKGVLQVNTSQWLLEQPLAALFPELATSSQQAPSASLTSEQEQLRLWEAVRGLLGAISASTPVIIVLDDLQWADASSCELLGYLARRLSGYPVLFIGTCRENELTQHASHPLRSLIAHMQRERSAMTLHINPLSGEQIALLVSQLSHQSNISASTLQHIQDQAAGNPFFAEELARTTPRELPGTITAALDYRLSRLSNPCQQLLGNASVLGGSFDFLVICSMDAGAAPLDEDTVLGLLEEALEAGVLTEEGIGTRISYHFWHPLFVSYLYDKISGIRRARLHRRAANVLQRVYQGRHEEVAATITYHLVQGDAEPVRIAFFAAAAAERAYILSAYAEAERYYRLAVEHTEKNAMALHEVGPTPTNSATAEKSQSLADLPGEQAPLLYLLERLAECNMIQGNFEEARRLYERVLQLRGLQDADSHEPDIVQYETQVRALLWGEIGQTWRYTGNKAQARACYERGEQELRSAAIVTGTAWARLRFRQSSLFWQEGRYDEALHAAQEALSLFEHQQSTLMPATRTQSLRTTRIQRTLEGDPVDLGRTYSLLGALANSVGRRTESLEYLNTALAIFEAHDQIREIAHVTCNMGYVYLKKADYELAHAALRRSLSLAERIGDAPLTSVVFSNLGELAAASGELAEAEAWYKKSLALAERFNDREYMSIWHASLAEVLRRQEKLNEAASHVLDALHIARAMHNAPCIGIALITLADIRVAQAQAARKHSSRTHARLLAQAKANAQRALAVEGLEAETRTRGRLMLARISSLLGETATARHLVEQVIEEARRYELLSIEKMGRALLEQNS